MLSAVTRVNDIVGSLGGEKAKTKNNAKCCKNYCTRRRIMLRML